MIPFIPEKGSVSASGDLAPLAHLAAVTMSEGEAFYCHQRMDGRRALEKAGLALIHGTDIDCTCLGAPCVPPL